MIKQLSVLDSWLVAADQALKTLAGVSPSLTRPPAADAAQVLSARDRALSASLMRVDHVGEVCAQALYQAQRLATRNPALRDGFEQAAKEEADHLSWTRQRLRELDARPSLLNPLWYAGSFAIGWLAGRSGDRVSLGFVIETERQVERHLADHLARLPKTDTVSRAIVAQMKADEARHAKHAEEAGGLPLPAPIRLLMRAAAKVMTTTAHHI